MLRGEVQNSSRFRIWNSANKLGSQGCVAKARFSRSALGREFGARLLRAGNDQTMRDLGVVCGARNTQFEQEFLGLFRAETVSAYDRRDRIGDFCVADYLAELDTVHVMRYSTRFSLHSRRMSSCPPKTRCITLRLSDRGLSLPLALSGPRLACELRLTGQEKGCRREIRNGKPLKRDYKLMAIHSPERNRS